MNMHIFEMPDSAEELSVWLEHKIAGVQLRELVSELAAVSGAGKAPCSLEDVLGGRAREVLQTGFQSFGNDELHTLLRYPQLLLDLQERVLAEGGEHWDHVLSQSPQLENVVAGARQGVESRLTGASPMETPTPLPPTPTPPPFESTAPLGQPKEETDAGSVDWGRGGSRQWSLATLAAVATAAACVLAALFLFQEGARRSKPATVAASEWGWRSVNSLPKQVSSSEYLLALAEATDAWFKKRPTTAEELADRILGFRHGCSRLLLAEHEPLREEDRDALRAMCRDWAKQLDSHLAAVEAGAPPMEVRKRVDDLIPRIKRKLEELAQQTS